MAIVQASKIQMRRGYEIDIPGEPATLSPLTFKAGLDVGEIGYALDTGRLFVGHNPANGHINHQRTSFPYQNIEILTENSTETISNLFNLNKRSVGKGAFFSATLSSNVTVAADILVARTSGSPTAFRFDSGEVVAMIDYFVYTFDNQPLRQGTLRFITEADQEDVVMNDTYIRSPQSVAQHSALADPDTDVFMTFKLKRFGGTSDPHFRFQYTSAITTETKLFFSVQRPIP